MCIRNKKIIWAFLVSVCLLGKGESTTFSEILVSEGLPRWVAVAANTARQFTVGNPQSNTAWSLAAAIHVSGRIGGSAGQITGAEFAELLDHSRIAPVVPVADPEVLEISAGNWQEHAFRPAAGNGCKVVYGGGLECASDFVRGVRGYRIGEARVAACEGMWFTPCSNVEMSLRADSYAYRHSPLYFDRPVVLVAEVYAAFFMPTANAYEKVLLVSAAPQLSNVQIFSALPPADFSDLYPAGKLNMTDFSTDYTFLIKSSLSPSLADKLRRWRVG